jgi:hypothetical protein
MAAFAKRLDCLGRESRLFIVLTGRRSKNAVGYLSGG